MMTKGFLVMVLHAHLPFVRHPDREDYLEERWLHEAITETYIPLIKVFQGLVRDGIRFRLTLSLSPPLMAMLNDPLLQRRYLKHLNSLRELAAKEIERTRDHWEFNRCAHMYQQLFEEAYELYHLKYQNNLLTPLRELQEAGVLEIITCGATHGYLPLLGVQRETARAQVRMAVEEYERHFGRRPQGIWLPECAYNPGDEEILRDFGLRYFFVDTHGVLHASPRPRYGIFAPLQCPSGVAVFGRDLESSKQVWSAQEGYPGDYEYREFYRDIGYDLDFDYIKPYIHPQGIRTDTGMKYFRITGRTEFKQPYLPERAREKAAIHAGNFMFNREKQIEYLSRVMDRPPVVVSPYDAELFGHWWFEGPLWLDFMIRKAAHDQSVFRLATASDYLDEFPVNQPALPSMSSWGLKGYNEVWLNGSNDWIYRHLHQAAERMARMAGGISAPSLLQQRALNQAARELLLAQSSDWAFIMKTGTMVDYAVRRTKVHLLQFLRLEQNIARDQIDEEWLEDLEEQNNIFPHLDYRCFQPYQ